MTQLNSTPKPRPCLGYGSAQRIENGVPCCMGCDKPIKDHPIEGRAMAPAPQPEAQEPRPGDTVEIPGSNGPMRMTVVLLNEDGEAPGEPGYHGLYLEQVSGSRTMRVRLDAMLPGTVKTISSPAQPKPVDTKNPAKDEVSGPQESSTDQVDTPIVAQDGAQVEGLATQIVEIVTTDCDVPDSGMVSGWRVDEKLAVQSIIPILATATREAYERALYDLRTWIEANRGSNVNADAIYGYIDAKLAELRKNRSSE